MKCNTKVRSIYFSSFVSFFFDFTLATVSRTAWLTTPINEGQISTFLCPYVWNSLFYLCEMRIKSIIHMLCSLKNNGYYINKTYHYQPAAPLHCCWSFLHQLLKNARERNVLRLLKQRIEDINSIRDAIMKTPTIALNNFLNLFEHLKQKQKVRKVSNRVIEITNGIDRHWSNI